MQTDSRQTGISLVELMVTISIIALTLTLGIPAFTGSRSNMQRDQVMLSLTDSLTLARSEAARRGVPVRVCASSNGTDCSTDSPPVWNTGWIVFTDVDEQGDLDDGTDEMVHATQFAHPRFSLTPGNGLVNGVLFNLDGFPNATGSFTYCDERETRVYALGFVGRVEHISTSEGCP